MSECSTVQWSGVSDCDKRETRAIKKQKKKRGQRDRKPETRRDGKTERPRERDRGRHCFGSPMPCLASRGQDSLTLDFVVPWVTHDTGSTASWMPSQSQVIATAGPSPTTWSYALCECLVKPSPGFKTGLLKDNKKTIPRLL